MARKRYIVKLSPDERQALEQVVARGRVSGERIRRAQSLLKADAGPQGPGWVDQRLCEVFGITTRALQGLRKRAVELGPQVAVDGRYCGATHNRKIDGMAQATLQQIACSAPPPGRSRWTLKLLADRMVALEVVDSLSRETVRRHLKGGSTESARTCGKCGASPRSRTRRSLRPWKRFSKSITGRTTPGVRSSAWTNSASS